MTHSNAKCRNGMGISGNDLVLSSIHSHHHWREKPMIIHAREEGKTKRLGVPSYQCSAIVAMTASSKQSFMTSQKLICRAPVADTIACTCTVVLPGVTVTTKPTRLPWSASFLSLALVLPAPPPLVPLPRPRTWGVSRGYLDTFLDFPQLEV